MHKLVNTDELSPAPPRRGDPETAEKLTISRAGLARLTGCSKANITRRCRGLLAAACVGLRVDLKHPTAASYLARRGVRAEELLDAVARDREPRLVILDGFAVFVRRLRAAVAAPSADTSAEGVALRAAAAAFESWERARSARETHDLHGLAVD